MEDSIDFAVGQVISVNQLLVGLPLLLKNCQRRLIIDLFWGMVVMDINHACSSS